MKREISWQVLIAIGLVGIFAGRFTGGVIGSAIGVIGDICLLIGIANGIVAFFKNRKQQKSGDEDFVGRGIGQESVVTEKKSEEDVHAELVSASKFLKEKNRWILFLGAVIFFVAVLFFVIQDGSKTDVSVKDGAIVPPSIGNGDFAKKVTCSDLKPKIVAELKEEEARIKKNISLHKIFFSKEKDSCLFAYVVEDDYANRQCDLNAETVHYDSFVVRDYLSSQVVLRNTKGCYGYWADSFDASINLLENGMAQKKTGGFDFETFGK